VTLSTDALLTGLLYFMFYIVFLLEIFNFCINLLSGEFRGAGVGAWPVPENFVLFTC